MERYLSTQALSAGLAEIERESERRGREIVRLALQAHIDARGDGDVGETIVLAGEDGPLRLAHKRVHSRPLVTLFGELRITRMGTARRDTTRSTHSTPSSVCLANGCPIASGTVEGACKNLIRDRFERSGMRWTPETAEAHTGQTRARPRFTRRMARSVVVFGFKVRSRSLRMIALANLRSSMEQPSSSSLCFCSLQNSRPRDWKHA